ncbi:hypothetical protein HOLleu_02352 [Holothuria leucospilota]|uniref:C2H2-type domain-containing protein n=1 Tax=Holothuria leucospilota TaxID=206669 RepID=A0A9Q1CRN5_HOLLE|nr:hypothetical protein HOLleu_02352 [Holothuria leucospilota]
MRDMMCDRYENNWGAIRTHHRRHNRVQDVYNFRLNELDGERIGSLLLGVYNDQRVQFKLNMSFGFMLRHRVNGELRYFHASHNNHRLFERPYVIGTRQDIIDVAQRFKTSDIGELVTRERENSAWVLEYVTNVSIYVFKLGDFPLGDGVNCEEMPKALFARYHSSIGGKDGVSTFKGVSFQELGDVEKCFQCNIYVYELEPNASHDGNEGQTLSSQTVAKLLRRSPCRFQDSMYLNYYDGHFSYIKNMNFYAHTFSCSRCRRLFKHNRLLQRHIPRCNMHVKHRFPGGVFQLSSSVFDTLEAVGIVVHPRDRFYPYRITYDIETYLDKEDVIPSKSAKLNYIGQHKLLSISVCSNVPGYDRPQCFISKGDDPQLVDNFVIYMTEISQAAFEHMTEGGPISTALQSIKELVKDYGPMDDLRRVRIG